MNDTIMKTLGELWNLFGPLIGFLGVLVGAWATGRWHHTHWVLENKKQEWRELIDALVECAREISKSKRAKPEQPEYSQLFPAQLKGSVFIQNRIFIAKVVERNSIKDDWNELLRISDLLTTQERTAGNEPIFLDSNFRMRFAEFHRKLVSVAQKDLGIP